MPDELLESEAIEEPVAERGPGEEEGARPLPEPASPGRQLSVWREEVRTAALAAGAGIVAGAATVAAVRAGRGVAGRRRGGRRALLGRERQQRVVASRSFLVDVHVLGSK